METIRIDAIEPRLDSATLQRPLTGALGAEHLALNYYELAPGDSFAYGYHAHADQEEVFVVEAGRVTFETADGDVEVGAGEAIRFAPGEYQRGTNRGAERVVALAIGAPRVSGETEILVRCETCGDRTPNTIEVVDGGEAKVTRCLECGAETARYGRDR